MKPVIRCMILMMILVLLIPVSFAQEVSEPEDTQLAVENQPEFSEVHSAPEGFEHLKASKAAINKHHTAIRIPGFEHTVYAYLDHSGGVVYLVYGQLDKKKGMYEAELNTRRQDGEILFILNIIGTEPHKTLDANLGRPKGVKLNAATLPEGYKKTSKTGVCYFTNLFGQKEYRVLGRIEGRADTYYPAQYGKPKPGGLPIDISQDRDRFLNKGDKKQKLPKEYKNGFATPVLVLSKQAEWVSVMTDKPLLENK